MNTTAEQLGADMDKKRLQRRSVWLSALLKLLPYAALIAAILIIPRYVYQPSAGGNNYQLSVLIYVGLHTVLAVGLNLLMGYAGQVSLGHAAFYGMGAYASAILTTEGVPREAIGPSAAVIGVMGATAAVLALLRLESGRLALAVVGFIVPSALALHFGHAHGLPYLSLIVCCALMASVCRVPIGKLAAAYGIGAAAGIGTLWLLNHTLAAGGLSPWCAILVGMTFTCLIAYLVGVQTLRLQGYYLAMATLGFGVIISIAFLQWEPVTGGTSGIYAIPELQIAGRAIDNDISMYYLVWALVAVVIALSANIINSRVGRAFRAVHGSEVAASTLGVDTAKCKVHVFVLSAALASVAGSLYAHYVTFISPEPFGFKYSVELVVMVVVGGMASVWGAILGAGVITVLGEALRGLSESAGQLGQLHHHMERIGLTMSDLDVVVFGLILMLIMIYLPAGLVRGVMDGAKMLIAVRLRKPGRK